MSNKPIAWIDLRRGGIVTFDAVWASKVDDKKPIPLYTHQYERPHNTVLVPCDKLAEMQAEIEALKALLVEQQDESFDRTASHMAGEYVSHPVKEHDIGISHAIGFDDGFKAGMQRAVEMNVVKELTDEEILEVAKKMGWRGALGFLINFARAILRKAQEK